MDKYTSILKALKDLRWYTIILLFTLIILLSFRTEIERVIDLKWSNKDLVVSNLENDVTIDESLQDLLVAHKANRAWIIRFHNGVTYYNGTHKSKMSCDYEVVAEGVSSEAQSFQDVPTALYSRWIKDIVEMKMFFCYVKDMSDLRIKHLLNKQGVKAIAVSPYYRDGKLFALIGIDYTVATSKEDCVRFCGNKESIKMKFKVETDQIGELLL